MTLEQIEQQLIASRVLIKQSRCWEIELVNCDAQVAIVLDPLTEEYEQFHYTDITAADVFIQ